MSCKKKNPNATPAQKELASLLDKTSIESIFLPTFDYLKEQLFAVIKTQAGLDFFSIFETVLDKAHACRQQKNTDFSILVTYIKTLSSENCSLLIKSLNLFFQLSNLAEDQYRVSVNQARRLEKNAIYPNTFKELLQFAKTKGVDLTTFLGYLEKIDLSLVWTSHPTETTTMSHITSFQAIIDLIQTINNTPLNQKVADHIKRHITLLWQSEDVQKDRIKVIDEVRRNLYYLETTLFQVVPEILDDFAYLIADTYNVKRSDIQLPSFLFFNLWSGGDRDGNPYVTAQMTQYALCLQRRNTLRRYLALVNQLLKEFSLSSNKVSINAALAANLRDEESSFPHFSDISQKLNPQEPYRRKCDLMRLKLEHNLALLEQFSASIGLGKTLVGYSPQSASITAGPHYKTMDALLADCYLIKESLAEHDSSLVSLGSLQTLIDTILTFENLYLDIRQHSEVHHSCIKECFEHIDLQAKKKSDYSFLLHTELIHNRTMGYTSFLAKLSNTSQELFNTLDLIKNPAYCFSDNPIRSYIISMTQSKDDIYGLMLLFKEVGLLQVSNRCIDHAMIDIVPLFETLTDLNSAVSIMRSLFEDPFYRSYLAKRDDVQEIMLGYSDSNKDVGPLTSQITIMHVQQDLQACAQEFGITLRFFHGRGGSISRGGGPMNESIRALPSGTLTHLKITEQGEKISINYLNNGIAYRHLEQIIHAVIYHHIQDDNTNTNVILNSDDKAILHLLADASREKYEALVKHQPGFKAFFHDVTPIDLIEYSTIGSRPAKRVNVITEDCDLTTVYRAIPWVFSWMQTRLLISGFYGIGTALDRVQHDYGLSTLEDWYKNWPFFHNLIQNLQMVLLKANMPIAATYMSLAHDQKTAHTIFTTIQEEYDLCLKHILRLIHEKELMYKNPKIRGRILRRNPFVDPLNILQVQLLQQWRSSLDLDPHKKDALLKQLGETVNGITAGVRNFG